MDTNIHTILCSLLHTHLYSFTTGLIARPPLSALILKFNMCVFVTSVQHIICSNLSLIAFWNHANCLHTHTHSITHTQTQVIAPASEEIPLPCRNRSFLWIRVCVLTLRVFSATMKGWSNRGGKYIPDIRDIQPDWT